MYVLDNTFSKRKANLVYRGTLSRRRPTGKSVKRVDESTQQPSSAINLNFESPSNLSKLSDKKMGCDFKGNRNELWRKIVFKTVVGNEGKNVVFRHLIHMLTANWSSDYLDKPELLVYPVPVRTNSLPLPDVCSPYISSSSLDGMLPYACKLIIRIYIAAAETGHFTIETRNKIKRRSSGGSMWRKARRYVNIVYLYTPLCPMCLQEIF